MSRRMTKGTALLFVGLLVSACDQEARTPACGSDQILGSDGAGHFVCVIAPDGAHALPDCPSALTSDGKQFLCASPDTSGDADADVRAAVAQLETGVDDVIRRVGPATPTPTYLGNLSSNSTGRIETLELTGLAAAAKLCAGQYGAGAHICGMDELYQAVVDGHLGAGVTIPPSWVFMPNWYTPTPETYDSPLRGVSDACGGYVSPTTSRGWRGILVEWGPLSDGTPGFRWHGGDEAFCSFPRPVTCCR